MEQAIWLVITVALFAVVVWGGFWTIGRAKLPQAANYVWGVIVLIALVFILVGLSKYGPVPSRWFGR